MQKEETEQQKIEKSISLGCAIGNQIAQNPETCEDHLREWLEEDPSHRLLFDKMNTPDFIRDSYAFHHNIDRAKEFRLFRKKQQKKRIGRFLRYSIPVAASVALGFILLFLQTDRQPQLPDAAPVLTEILPGKAKAILVLENNRQLALTDHSATIREDARLLANAENARLTYPGKVLSDSCHIPRHRLITPQGGEYRVTLADGTKVWLNAGTELSYPTQFTGKEREVVLKGEAYFEVAPDKNHPFRIHSDELDIVVTGTAFNVSVYPDEPKHQIALVHGGVEIRSGQKLLGALHPGEKLEYNVPDQEFIITDADLESIVAWKNGYFLFKEEPLSSITRKLGRWYNVEFKIRPVTTDRYYSGLIKRDEPLENMLHILKLTNEIDYNLNNEREIEIIPLK